MMPEKDDFEQLLSQLGIDNNDQLIVYDDKGSVDAARLWWLFRYYYIDEVKVLNGGLRAWREAGGQVSVDITSPKTSQFYLPDSTRGQMLVSKDELKLWTERNDIGFN